jgi:hypothetical protein
LMKSISILTLISISVSAALVSISDSLVNWRLPIPERFEIACVQPSDLKMGCDVSDKYIF